MAQFIPKKKKNTFSEIKEDLMNGNIIRYDGYHDSVEVLPRTFIKDIAKSGNLFQHSGILKPYYKDQTQEKKTIQISSKAIKEVFNELNEEYMIHKVLCEDSGCCQYATWAIYLL